MTLNRPIFFLWITLLSALIYGQVGVSVIPVNRNASAQNSLRILSLGELQFSDPALFNLYDQGGSPMGLLENHSERINLSAGLLNSDRASSGDSLVIKQHQFFIPQFGFYQPGVFGAVLYFQKENETYDHKNGDTAETSRTSFGIDLAAGPASGLFRIGFGVHAMLGTTDYPGDPERFILEVPSLRLDLGSKIIKGVEVGIFTGLSAHFDSLNSPQDKRERLAVMTLPRYGLLADVGGLDQSPVIGNVKLELGTHRFFGEYRPVNQGGLEYPTIWNDYFEFKTQWLYPFHVQDFLLQPSIKFSHRSEDAQGYRGITGNQNPLKKGDLIQNMAWTTSTTNFGVGANALYHDYLNLILEWETSGKNLKVDSSSDQQYTRFAIGTEVKLDQIEYLKIPKTISLALRMGWTSNQEPKNLPGYRDYHFTTFIPSQDIPTQKAVGVPKLDTPVAYSAFHIGFGAGILNDKLELNGILSFPSQLEVFTQSRSQDVSGTELGVNLTAKVF